MRKVVCHITFHAMLRRPVLSCLSQVYTYIAKMGDKRSPVWNSVSDELRCVRALLPLCHVDLRAVSRSGAL
eukprot:9466062-Heterocapsa_arctica.AAC.1